MPDLFNNSFRLYNGVTPVTGQGGNLSLRISPYAGDIAGLVFTETPAASANYVISGMTDYYELAQVYLSTVLQTSIGKQNYGDPKHKYHRLDGTNVPTADFPMGGFGLTGLRAAVTGGEPVEYIQGAILARNNTYTGLNLFSTAAGTRPTVVAPTANPPVASGHLTDLAFIIALFGTTSGMRQSNYEIQCLPSVSINDTISQQAIEDCVTYIKGLSGYASNRGCVNIGNTGAANNNVNLGTGSWLTDGIDFRSKDRVRITLSASNDNVTSDSVLDNLYILDPINAARLFTNQTFKDCDINCSGGGNLTLTGVKFLGICRIKMNGGVLTFANCKGTTAMTNASVVYSGSTRPIQVFDGLDSSSLGL